MVKNRTKLYNVWLSMRNRCNNPNNKDYARYGGRGIKVSPEWDIFEAFREWAEANGYVEGESTIERIDNDLGYSPENCKFIPNKENAKHRSNVYNIDGMTLKDYCAKHNLNYYAILSRISHQKKSLEEALY